VRVGVLGGSFDPVHLGHLVLALRCREGADLGRVVLMVAGRPPHKRERVLAPAEHRVAMARLAARGTPWLDVDDRETRRDGPSWTLDTLSELRAERPEDELLWIIGADSLPDLPSWRNVGEIIDVAGFVVAARPGHDTDAALAALAPKLGEERVARIAANVVPMTVVDVSSTDVRRRVREGRSIRFLVPDAVREHVLENDLYRE
jgi:nicotinate-nucleotide adenylyltransferase